MRLHFADPRYLLLLPVALLLVVALGRRLNTLSRARRHTVLILRALLFLALILALARLEMTRKSDELSVMFLVDDSSSIPQEMRQYARKFIDRATLNMGLKDTMGVLLFGGDASIERSPQRKPEKIEEFKSLVPRNQTNIAEAMRLAMAALPAHAKKRIVVLSDGNQTMGDAEEAAQRAAGNQVAVDVVPLSYQYRDDIIVEDLVVENQVSVDEPFDVKVMVRSRRDSTAKLNILRDGQVVATQQVKVEADKKNVFVLPTKAADSGFHTFQAVIESPTDTNAENNTAYGFTMAQGEPKVLLVEGGPLEENVLAALLRAEKIDVQLITPSEFPSDPVHLQQYNSIILSNVPASDFSQGQMQLIERVVHEMGMGLIMTGGDQSFGAGGWQDSPVEEALPVEMEIKHKKILPKGALALILHTAEINQQEYWARQIAVASLNVLSSRDEFGALAYDWQKGESWVVPLQEARDKAAIRRIIMNGGYGDMPQFAPTMKMALDGLKKSNASVKHMIVISDGDPQPPSQALINEIVANKITVSTVEVAGHGLESTMVLKEIAQRGNGRFYQVKNNQTLPQIFVKEASVVRKSLIIEDPFVPVAKSYSDLLAGIGPKEYPQLMGYVGSSPKDLADKPLMTNKDDPLLAYWRYGLGKTVAFTSDTYMKWAKDWYSWNKMSKFWSQVVRWTLRPQSSRNLQLTSTIEEGKAKIAVDAVDDDGKFLNFLNLDASIIAPDYKSEKIELRQTAPGRYEAEMPLNATGNYLVNVEAKGANNFHDVTSGGVALSYSPEFRSSRSDDGMMKKLSEIGKGRVLDETMNVFDHNLPGSSNPQPLFPYLLALAMLLLPIDIFFRRVMVDWGMVKAGVGVVAAYVRRTLRPRRDREEREQRIEALLDAKKQAMESREQEAEKRAPAMRKDLLDRLDQVKPEQDFISTAKTSEASTPVKSKPADKPDTQPPAPDDFTSKLLQAKKRAKK